MFTFWGGVGVGVAGCCLSALATIAFVRWLFSDQVLA
jgi:hypothetical protein